MRLERLPKMDCAPGWRSATIEPNRHQRTRVALLHIDERLAGLAKAAMLEGGGGAGAKKPRTVASPDEDERRRQEYRARVKKEDSAKAMKRASMDTARL